MWDLSSWTRNRTPVPCICGRVLNHWTTREVPLRNFKCCLIFGYVLNSDLSKTLFPLSCETSHLCMFFSKRCMNSVGQSSPNTLASFLCFKPDPGSKGNYGLQGCWHLLFLRCSCDVGTSPSELSWALTSPVFCVPGALWVLRAGRAVQSGRHASYVDVLCLCTHSAAQTSLTKHNFRDRITEH